MLLKMLVSPGVVTHPVTPGFRQVKQKDRQEFKISLDYIMSSGHSELHRETLFQKNQEEKS